MIAPDYLLRHCQTHGWIPLKISLCAKNLATCAQTHTCVCTLHDRVHWFNCALFSERSLRTSYNLRYGLHVSTWSLMLNRVTLIHRSIYALTFQFMSWDQLPMLRWDAFHYTNRYSTGQLLFILQSTDMSAGHCLVWGIACYACLQKILCCFRSVALSEQCRTLILRTTEY